MGLTAMSASDHPCTSEPRQISCRYGFPPLVVPSVNEILVIPMQISHAIPLNGRGLQGHFLIFPGGMVHSHNFLWNDSDNDEVLPLENSDDDDMPPLIADWYVDSDTSSTCIASDGCSSESDGCSSKVSSDRKFSRECCIFDLMASVLGCC